MTAVGWVSAGDVPTARTCCLVTIFIDDLDAQVAEIAVRGQDADEGLTYSNGVRKAVYRDPDGNELGSGGAPVQAR